MEKTLTLTLPLEVYIPRKTKSDRRWILNMNNYRNTHYLVLNQVKHLYSDIVKEELSAVWSGEKITYAELEFRYYPKTNRRVDKSNPCSIIEKFSCDALTEYGIWEDDDSITNPITTYRYMGSDADNPRCEMIIKYKTT